MFSYDSRIYNISDINKGEVLNIRKGVKIKVILEILTKKLYVIYFSKKYECNDLGPNSKHRRKTTESSKELNELLDDLKK